MNSLFSEPRKLTTQEQDQLDDEFELILNSPDEREQLFAVLHKFVSKFTVEQDFEFRSSYTRWYVDLFWRKMPALELNDVIKIGIARHASLALALDFDVWQELIIFLGVRSAGVDDLESMYGEMQEVFLSSQAILGSNQGNKFTLSDFIKEIKIVKLSTDTDLNIVELIPRLRKSILEGDMPLLSTSYIKVLPDELVSTIGNLTSFFLGVKKEKIFYLVDVYLNGEKFSNTTPKPAPTPQEPQALVKKNVVSSMASPIPELSKNASEIRSPSNQEIKKMVEAVFPPSAKPDFKGMVAMLNTLAEKYGNDSIRDLYVFNEQTGSFEWNVNLLR